MATKRNHTVSIDFALKDQFDRRSTIPFSHFIEAAMRLSLTWDATKMESFIKQYGTPMEKT